MPTVLKGNILHLPVMGQYEVLEHGYLVLEDGVIEGLYPVLPERFAPLPVEDFGDKLIVQAFCDMHLHAPQYAMLGMGLDLPLLKWLDAYAFPAEARFSDTDFARRVYRALANALLRSGTTRVCVFGSLHCDATLILMEELARCGISGYVGKVNMDQNGAPDLEETTEGSMRETMRFLDGCAPFAAAGLLPILTPRFTPSCSNELMRFLGELRRERGLRVQSHLSENLAEISWVGRLHPDCPQYWESYEKYGLFTEGTVMAHCVHSDGREQEAMRKRNVLVAHCPDSNINLCSGFPPVREMLDRGLWVALGSDIAGGAELAMNRVVTAAVRMSDAKRIASNWRAKTLTVAEAAYLATTSAAKYFGAGAGFAKGDALHALVLDDAALPVSKPLTVPERFERLLYLMTPEQIAARYAGGKRIEPRG